MSEGWWPIECMPLDGMKVDLWVLDGRGVGRRVPDCCWVSEGWVDVPAGRFLEDSERATHWRSIPSGPHRAHVLDGGKCWCLPQVEDHGALLVIHNDAA